MAQAYCARGIAARARGTPSGSVVHAINTVAPWTHEHSPRLYLEPTVIDRRKQRQALMKRHRALFPLWLLPFEVGCQSADAETSRAVFTPPECDDARLRRWRYSPTLLNGEPVGVDTEVSIVYRHGENRGLNPESKTSLRPPGQFQHRPKPVHWVQRRGIEPRRKPAVVVPI